MATIPTSGAEAAGPASAGDWTQLILVITISIGISALCSVLEAVLLSISPTYVALLRERGERAGVILHKLRSRIDDPISAILTLNTIAHTIGAAISGAVAARVFGSEWLGVFSAVLTLLILVLSEILPKSLGSKAWRQLAKPSAYILRGLVLGLLPAVWLLRQFSKLVGSSHGQNEFDRREIEMLARIGLQRGSLSENEVRTVSNLLSLDSTRLSEVMTPRHEIVSLHVDASLEEARRTFTECGYTRLVIFDNDLDDVQGTLTLSALLSAEEAVTQGGGEQKIADWLKPTMFIPATRTINSMLQGFRRADDSVAIVIDEFGSTKGLVTLHDLLEEIVGEIYEGSEGSEEPLVPLGRGRFRLAGRLSLRELERRLGIKLEADVDTVAGFVVAELGRLAEKGDAVEIDGGVLRVEEVEERRVETLLLERSR